MSLVSGPGRARTTASDLPEELQLVVKKHIEYIKTLDKVSNEYRMYVCSAHVLIAER